MKKMLFFLLAAGMVAACSNDGPDAYTPTDFKPISLSRSEQDVAACSTEFGWKVFEALVQDEEPNVVFSPLSLNLVLGMTANGAQGETQREIVEAVNLGNSDVATLNSLFSKISDRLPSLDNTTDVKMANSLWHGCSSLRPAFTAALQDNYDAELREISVETFQNDVNRWVSKKTEGMIDKIIDDNEGPGAAMFLNALLFKGKWQVPFEKKDTKKDDFHNFDGTVSKCDFLNNRHYNLWGYAPDCSYVSLPYGNSAYEFVVVLPDEDKTVEDCVRGMLDGGWAQMRKTATPKYVVLSMPKFEMSTTRELKDALEKCGISLMFDPFGCNLSGMTEEANGMFVSRVQQFNSIIVDEEGTKAASATKEVDRVTASYHHDDTITFKVDCPYVFAVTEQSTGTILFLGKVSKL